MPIVQRIRIYMFMLEMGRSHLLIVTLGFNYWLQYFYNKESVRGAGGFHLKIAVLFLCQRFWLSFFDGLGCLFFLMNVQHANCKIKFSKQEDLKQNKEIT